jgi:acetyltransferase-like isoleucine patch superfamily enzyme
MTWRSRAMAWFPALVIAAALLGLAAFVASPGVGTALLAPAALYGLPLAAWRLHQRAWPLREGAGLLRGAAYDAWWGGHQIQWVYLAFPSLEAALRAAPGLYSAWLRAWGSAIGRDVYWTPGLTIADRSLLVVGDGAIFGHGVAISAHVVKPTDGGDLLRVVRGVRVGAGAFIGAGAVLGPGAVVEDGAVVPAGAAVLGGRKVRG